MTPRERVIRVLLKILSHPYRYTRRDLTKDFECSKKKINEDIKAIQDAGLTFKQDKNHHCAILPDYQFDELQYLLPLNEEDKRRINRAFDYMNAKDRVYLRQKINSLYDFQKLGLDALRQPALERINLLETTKKQKRQVLLKNYRSNSNTVRDRYVEVFDVNPELDTVQAFDVEIKENRHFRLKRMDRGLKMLDISWQYENQHDWKPTDVFRITGKQVRIHLKLTIYAYNSLIDNYPRARGECLPSIEPNIYDFETNVNNRFLGITNYLMANAGQATVVYPEELKEEVRKKIKILQKSLEE